MEPKIKREAVLKVYSGRPGCCCGCRGKYTYRKETAAIGAEERGYSMDAGEVNEGVVTKVLNVINNDPRSVDEGGHVFLDTGARWYIAYRIRALK